MTPTTARAWLDLILEPGWVERFADITASDPLAFPGYAEQLERARADTGEAESIVVAEGRVLGEDGIEVVALASEFAFLGGTMSAAAGERIARAFEHAAERGTPVVAMLASGGARIQEGMLALAQMPATLDARAALARAGIPFIAYLRNPTTGGVYASFASSADLLWAEPGATIGFAGPRVAETFTGAPLPEGSHSAEAAHAAGLVDQLVAPAELRGMLIALRWLRRERPGRPVPPPPEPPPGDETPWTLLQRARDDARRAKADPSGGSLAMRSADPSVEPGFAQIGGRNVVVIVVSARAHTPEGRILGPSPAGFRAARHAIEVAGRLGLPLVTFIDTPGAEAGPRSERGGIAAEIARTFQAMAAAPIPTVACVTGEGGSGGALALANADRLLIQRNAVFSVIAPEGAASILRRDDIEGVANDLRLSAHELRARGLADLVVTEPDGGSGADPERARATLHEAIAWALADIEAEGAPTQRRRARWRVGGAP